MPDGQRQIVDFQIPGDFLGLRSVLLRTSDHTIEPVTDIEVMEIHVEDLLKAFANAPRLGVAVLWAARATRQWLWSIWWGGSGGAMRRSGWRISWWSWARA